MNREDFWRTFALNRELHVAGGFIYDGIQDIRKLETFHYSDEVFRFAYHLAVGFERLLKIAVVLLEFTDKTNSNAFENSLKTHSHSKLLQRVRTSTAMKLKCEDNEFVDILGKFYFNHRYDNFSLNSVSAAPALTQTLVAYFRKHVATFKPEDEVFGLEPCCSDEVRGFIGGVCRRIASQLYSVISDAAQKINLYTYELRCDSKAFKVFILNELHFGKENLLWKELLVFFMNVRVDTPEFKFLRQIKPLDFEPCLIADYLESFSADTKKLALLEELNEHYRHIEGSAERLDMMEMIGSRLNFFEECDYDEGETE